MTFPVYEVVFFFFAAVLITAATLVIVVRNPVYAALYLVLTFFCSAVLWMMLQAEFLSLVLIFVYVGAVMTLFLFVVMMLNIDLSAMREKFVRYVPLGVLVMVILLTMLIIMLTPRHLPIARSALTYYGTDYSNVKTMGTLLFTDYLYPFEIAAVILLVAIIAAISLAFHGRKLDTKAQRVSEQHNVRKKDRIRIVKMKVEE